MPRKKKKEEEPEKLIFKDILGRQVGVGDLFLYSIPEDGMHAAVITMEDKDGMLYVSRVKSEGLKDGREWLDLYDTPEKEKKWVCTGKDEDGRPKFKEVEEVPVNRWLRCLIKASREYYPITTFPEFIKMEPLDEKEKIDKKLVEKIC